MLLIFIVFFINEFFINTSSAQKFTKNKCNTIEALIKDKQDCIYNPDEFLDVPQIIARHGYHSETHVVVTKDGYLLKLHRIPGTKSGERGGQPVFLQHGILGSSADWIINENNSLAFLLADDGYDVWLGNARGNTYSKGHISLSSDDPQFWDFSWHEMGVHDIPAALLYVAKFTKMEGEIIYIGHSMGTTMYFVFASENPQVAKEVKLMVALAPIAYMTHIQSPIKYLAPFSSDFQWLSKYLGLNQFLPNNKIMKFLAYDCELFKIDKEICENIIFLVSGFDKAEFNQKILPVVLNKDPAGTSTKTVVHYAQEVKNAGNFQQFDFGTRGNMIRYGTVTPPAYNVSRINTPVYLMYGENDWMASFPDVQRLAKNITNLIGMYKIKLQSFNHIDFLFGKDAVQLVYQPLMEILRNFTG